ncbi:hypothetical protein GJV85_04435 [Sulfurimonas aquatica]|uniref:Lipoprotein LPP20-like domain-containing protein n=1 Tax=Sulfurimonas aquatica TaxID=2672570 RepID=A0A975AZH6_9BACT|nr:LPP20 family lipoprotein [Sulfurimonas aquatica]QSZ41383.1 hypothetical protein GJV85_04435 [Sulfurimonas aquatica]
MKIFLKMIFLTSLTTLFIGCGGATGPTPSALPQWYLNPPQSNQSFYYGVGEGSSKDAAKANALAQIGGTIAVNISSELDMKTEVHNDEYSENVKTQTKASVEKIKFTGVNVIENAYIAGKYYSYLNVDRAVLFDAQESAMKVDYANIKSLYKTSKEGNIFELIKNRDKIESKISTLMSKFPILKAINSGFNESVYSSELSKIKEDLRNSPSRAMVYVSHENSKELAEVLKNHISTYGMTLVDTPRSANEQKNLLKVNVSRVAQEKNVKMSDPRLIGASFADVTVTLTTRNSTNNIIAQNRVNIINISKDGYAAAVVKTAKFEREIQKRGILNILLENAAK